MNMSDQEVTTLINAALCNGCGLCSKVCPRDTISLVDGKAAITGDTSLNCGHCEAICPEGAIKVTALTNVNDSLNTCNPQRDWLKPGISDIASLVRLMRSRRSCRNFRMQQVPLPMLEDLIKIGISAPSGTNSQKWTFTLLPNRDAVMVLIRRMVIFFEHINKMVEKIWLRGGLKLLGKSELSDYYTNYYPRVKKALREFAAGGRERLFHGAPAVILIGSSAPASTPAEDALLATQNILLAAHAMGLGTCLVGYVVAAARKDPQIKTCVNIPVDESIYSVIALGYPDEIYQDQAKRKNPLVRIFS